MADGSRGRGESPATEEIKIEVYFELAFRFHAEEWPLRLPLKALTHFDATQYSLAKLFGQILTNSSSSFHLN